MKAGETVILDNRMKVELESLGTYFAIIKTQNREWAVMKNRLTSCSNTDSDR